MRDVIVDGANVADQVKALRGRFLELRFCFDVKEYADLIEDLHALL